MYKKIISLFGLVVLLSSLSVRAQQAVASRFELADPCFVDITIELNVDCGYVNVPEFYDGRTDGEVKLAVFRIRATGDSEGASPMFFLDGGPGGSAKIGIGFNQSAITQETQALTANPDAITPVLGILKSRDIVLFSQRGTEFSEPYLTCPEVNSALYRSLEQGLGIGGRSKFEAELLQKCVDEFVGNGVDLNAFNSFANADDVNSVREALGYNQIIYYGESYGAQLGEFVMQRHPEILEAVILDGVNPLSKVSWADDRAVAMQDSLEMLLQLCSADEHCAAGFENPLGLLDAALATIENGQLTTSVASEDGNIKVDFDVTIEFLALTVFGKLNSIPGAWPAILSTVSEGDTRLIGSAFGEFLFTSMDPTKAPLADVQHFAMVCSDDPELTQAVFEPQAETTLAIAIETLFRDWYRTACPILNVELLPAISDENVRLDVPTLILSGALLDTSTPPKRNQEVADALPNARLVSFPYGGHVQYTRNDCSNSLVSQFVVDPSSLHTLDTSCIAELPAPTFFTLEDLNLN